MQFIVDVMLSDLARYLRFMGYSCIVPSDKLTDTEVLKLVNNNTLVTADKELAERARKKKLNIIFVDIHGTVTEKLAAVVSVAKLEPHLKNALCPKCNGQLIEQLSSQTDIYPYLKKKHKYVYVCRECGHIYWKGTHWKAMVKIVKRAEQLAIH